MKNKTKKRTVRKKINPLKIAQYFNAKLNRIENKINFLQIDINTLRDDFEYVENKINELTNVEVKA